MDFEPAQTEASLRSFLLADETEETEPLEEKSKRKKLKMVRKQMGLTVQELEQSLLLHHLRRS